MINVKGIISVVNSSQEEIHNKIEEFADSNIAEMIYSRALDYKEAYDKKLENIMDNPDIEDELKEFKGMKPEWLVYLNEVEDVKTLEDFAYLSGWEFQEAVQDVKLSEALASSMILKARQIAFKDK